MKKFIYIPLFSIYCLYISSLAYCQTYSTSTIKPAGGGNYTGLIAWEAGEQNDLVKASSIAVAECYAGQDLWNNTALTISGWNTSATNYIDIHCAAGQSHSGKWDDTKFVIISSKTAGIFHIAQSNVRVSDLQIEVSSISSCFYFDTPVDDVNYQYGTKYFNRNILRYYGQGLVPNDNGKEAWVCTADSGTVVLTNNIAYNFGSGFVYSFDRKLNSYVLYNNTFINCDRSITNIKGGIYISGTLKSVMLKNNLVQGTTKCYETVTGITYSSTTNISSDATSPNVNYRSKVPNFVDRGNNDYHITQDTVTYQKGVNLSTDPDAQYSFTNDIDGQTRPTVWSIGADDIVAAITPTRRRPTVINIE